MMVWLVSTAMSLSFPGGCTFEGLPVEVLALVLQAVKHADPSSLITMRLVCRAFNALAEPLAFELLSFVRNYSDENLGVRLIALLEALADGTSPYSRWAHTLLIEYDGLYPYLKTSPSLVKDTNRALEARAKLLGPAMGSLGNLKRASIRIDPGDPYEAVLSALSKLPKLDELRLSLSHAWTSDSPLVTLDMFSNLCALELMEWRLFPSNLDAIERLLARCSSSLESLKLLTAAYPSNKWQWSDENAEEGEVRHVPFRRLTAETTFMRLKKLVIDSYGIHLSSFSPGNFAALTHLEIHWCTEDTVDAGFWTSLANSKIHLEALSVFPLVPRVCDYLASYSGLKTLRLCHGPRKVAPLLTSAYVEDMAERVFNTVLPKHRQTLRCLSFEGAKFDAFGLKRESVEKVLSCQRLECLWVLYDLPTGRPYDTAHPDFVNALSRIITSLPRLQELTFQPALRSYDIPLPPGSITIPVEPRKAESGRILATNVPLRPLKTAMARGFWASVPEAEENLEVSLIGGVGDVHGTARRGFLSRRIVYVEWEE
ncbi:hypothetical protein NMY22_g6323 [Coprinellus aureogranulatus]|nr:hypothetical protein NMY22_g6323 [Coprinellus aureogranulatus]